MKTSSAILAKGTGLRPADAPTSSFLVVAGLSSAQRPEPSRDRHERS
jgi:hypothetical protein